MGSGKIKVGSSFDTFEDFPKRKQQKQQKENNYQWITIVIALLVIYSGYHGVGAYNQQKETQRLQKEKAVNCLMQFKGSDCNPLKPTDKCEELVDCISDADDDDSSEINLIFQIISKTCISLSQTIVGPCIIVILLVCVNALTKLKGRDP